MRQGYHQARERFHEARLGTDATAAFIPLFEALNWATSIDEKLGFQPVPELRGLRFARHRVHHQWADALWLDEAGLELPTTLPAAFLEWRWRNPAELPSGRENRGEEDYREHLAGQATRNTLDAVWEFVEAARLD